ncbi:hypothetical protein HYS29_01675 [Candidatus Microgenomates bacterium]|nr:hypothetical protein [Candidatus Microgenomates bacterium]
MYIYFEDWSAFKWMLEKRGVPRRFIADRFIKAVACETHPRGLGYNGVILEYDGNPFGVDSTYVIGSPESTLTYNGLELEERIIALDLTFEEKNRFRALLRFGFDQRLKYVEQAVTTVIGGRRLKDHPIDTVDTHLDKRTGSRLPHFDFFTEGTLNRLDGMIGFRDRENVLFSPREGESFRQAIPNSQLEGNREITR